MPERVIIGDCTLYHGDALEIMPTLPKVDLILTDPPYLLESGGNTTSVMRGCFDKNNYDNRGAFFECPAWEDFMPLLADRLDHGHAYIMANNRHVLNMLRTAEDSGLKFHNLLVWDKITATPNRWYMKNCEFVGLFFKGLAQPINDCSAKQLLRCSQNDFTDHPTEKPVPLFEGYIRNSTNKGEMVLDPFMGSGSSGIAAMRTQRKYIGIEKDRKWFDVACERLKIVETADLFL